MAPRVTDREAARARRSRCFFPSLWVSHFWSCPLKHRMPATAPTESWKLTEAAVTGFHARRHRAAKARAVGGSYSF